MSTPHRIRGFSMVELLVVLFLIAFMLAALVVVFNNVTKRSKIQAAQTQLDSLSMALRQYYSDFREYPPDTAFEGVSGWPENGTKSANECLYDAGSLFRYLGRPVIWMKKRADGTEYNAGTFGPYLRFQASELKHYKDNFYGDSYQVVDPWGTPVGYVGDPRRVIHNRGFVDLYSCGPDKVTASNDKKGKHVFPEGFDTSSKAYDSVDNDSDSVVDNAPEFGRLVLNGCLTPDKKDKIIVKDRPDLSESLDDLNTWSRRQ